MSLVGDLAAVKGREFIYFVASGEMVKIGYTRSIGARLQKMVTDVPDPQILWIESGDLRHEKMLHRHFAHIRVRGEWFKKTPEMLAFIRQRYQVVRPDLPIPEELVEAE